MERAEKIAEKLAADWRDRAPYEALRGDLAPATIDEAYAAQEALQRRLEAARGPIAGRKIALSSKAMQAMVGLHHPVAGAVFANDLRLSTEAAPAEIALGGFQRLGVEFELAFEINADVAPRAADVPPHDAASARGLIAAARPAFELIEDRAADYAALDAFTLIADNAWCGGVVLGPPIAGWEGLDFSDHVATVTQSGVEPEAANAGAADPLASLAWVLEHASARGQTVKAGEIVITGSVVRTRFPKAGDALRSEIADSAVAMRVV